MKHGLDAGTQCRVESARRGQAVVAAAPPAPPSDALWKIVHDKCLPNEEQYGEPAPCAVVDLDDGDAGGYVVLKDRDGRRNTC